jgi:hypothetical protein
LPQQPRRYAVADIDAHGATRGAWRTANHRDTARAATGFATFFIKLGKLVANVIEALSVVFHLEEVIKTEQFLLEQLNDHLHGIRSNPAYPGLAAAVKNAGIPRLDDLFKVGEKSIKDFFDKLAADVAGTKINQLKGQGATAHTAFTLQPKSVGHRPRTPPSAPGRCGS